jgi:shikimate kinase
VSLYDCKNQKSQSNSHGAISIVNAIATGKGSALGISLKVTAEAELEKGHGINFTAGRRSDKLIKTIVQKTIPKKIIQENMISIRVDSEIPIGYGLKSSSAFSNAVALACNHLAEDGQIDDYAILDSSTRASLEANVTLVALL